MAFMLACAVQGQVETTAAIFGVVDGVGGLPVAVARVVVEHQPTVGRFTTTTNKKGVFVLTGLPVGGPYAVTVSAPGFRTHRQADLTLNLGETHGLEIALAPVEEEIVLLDKVVVVAARETPGAAQQTNLSREEIERQPSIENSLNEYAARDPRVVYVDPDRGELAAAGQNSRYNSLSVDGVRINDQFGVTPNGFPSQGNPLSLETIEAVNVDVVAYDLDRSGYAGAGIRAVSRSGTNLFHGSVYSYYRDQSMRAPHPVSGDNERFKDRTSGVTLGGPLWRNRLFFFMGYEQAERIEPAPDAGFDPSSAAIERIVAASARYGHVPGELVNPGKQNKQDNKYFSKLDWRITDAHRFSLRYSETRGHQPIFPDYTTSGRVSLSGHWFESEQNLRAWSAQLHSQWTPAFQSEIKVASHVYESNRTPNTRFPEVRIMGVPAEDVGTGSVFLGGEASSQVNALKVVNNQAGATSTWLVGRHRLLMGAEFETSDFQNAFLQNAWGSYEFSSLANFEAGKPSKFTYQYELPGHSPSVSWGYNVGSAFLQDTWTLGSRLTLSGGLRLDYPMADTRPQRNPLVEETFAMRNDRTIDGAYTVGPRGSFILKLDDKNRSRLRAGAGVFQGRAPGVWLSNAYTNDGFASAVNTTVSGFSPDPDNQPKGNLAAARQRVDLIDKGFHLPTVARASLAFDHRLPWQDITFATELVQTWTMQGLAYKNLNLRRTATGPDGRAIYGDRTKTFGLVANSQYLSPAFTEVYLLTNTAKGEATQATFTLKRPLRKYWGASLSYTRGCAVEVSPVTASTAATNFETRVCVDPNDDRLGTANYAIRDRVLADLSVRFSLVKGFVTTVVLQYEGRSGRPYSFVSGTDVNGDSSSYDNDLLYVPSGRDDPKVRWSNAKQADAFFEYLDGHPALKRFAGSIAPRNSERSAYQHQFDLKLIQGLPLRGRLRAELFLDVLNLANLLNDNWGRQYAVSFPYALAVANASYDPAANQYVYSFSGVKAQSLVASRSRWQMQGGARLKF